MSNTRRPYTINTEGWTVVDSADFTPGQRVKVSFSKGTARCAPHMSESAPIDGDEYGHRAVRTAKYAGHYVRTLRSDYNGHEVVVVWGEYLDHETRCSPRCVAA